MCFPRQALKAVLIGLGVNKEIKRKKEKEKISHQEIVYRFRLFAAILFYSPIYGQLRHIASLHIFVYGLNMLYLVDGRHNARVLPLCFL